MIDEPSSTSKNDDVPASLRRGKKEPIKQMQIRIPLSWWKELRDLGREYDQPVTAFLQEAIEDWLRRARRVRKSHSPETSEPLYPGVSE